MKKLFILYIVLINFTIHAQTIHIAAAGNLRFVLDEIKSTFISKYPNVTIEVNLGASGILYQQIVNGASCDIFIAADLSFPDKLKIQGFTIGEVKTYAFGKLVLWSNTVEVSKGMQILTDKSINHIAIAKPEVAPYGERAVQCLNYYKLYEKVKEKLVYADNISQTAQYAQTGNAEVGFLALSLALEMKESGKYFILDPKSYTPVEQACVQLKSSINNPEAAKFMTFLFSNECKIILKKYGYLVSNTSENIK